MHERLFANQKKLEPWINHAQAIGIDEVGFELCMRSDKHAAAVRKDMAEARKAGATGTPSFVLARTDPGDPNKVTGISFIRGARAFNDFKVEIDRALKQPAQ